MIKRISTALFKPQFVARYITDKLWVIILYFVFFCGMLTLPTIASNHNASLIDGEERAELADLLKELDYDIVFTNGVMAADSVVIQTNSYIYAFGRSGVSSKIVFHFGETKLSIIEFGFVMASKTYEEIGLTNTVINSSNALASSYQLVDAIYDVADNHLGAMKTLVAVYGFFSNVVNYLFITLILYLLGFFINNQVRGLIRYKIVLYSLIPLFLFDMFTFMSGKGIFHYIGVFYSVFVYFKALRAIVKIVYKKGPRV